VFLLDWFGGAGRELSRGVLNRRYSSASSYRKSRDNMDLVDVMLIAGGGIDNELLETVVDTILFIEEDNHGTQEENHPEQGGS